MVHLGRRARHASIAILVVVAILVAARIALNPLVAWRTRTILDEMRGMRGHFDDVAVNVHDLSYEIRGLSIEKVSAGGAREPYFSVARAKFGLYFKELIRGHVVAAIDLDRPRLTMIAAKQPEQKQQVAEAPEVGKSIQRLAPFRVDRLQVKDGDIRWIDATEREHPVLRLHGIEGTVENFATRKALSEDQPTVLAMRGTLQRTGRVSVFATADPLTKKLTFAGQGRLTGLALSDIGTLVNAKSGVEPTKGTFDLEVKFEAKDGRITGGVRPVLKDAGLKAGKGGLMPKVKALLADTALKLFRDEVPGRHAVATTIPIKGTVDDPNVQAVPTILGILRNAFVRGLSESMSGLPPPTAPHPQNVLEQARRAFSPSRSAEPRAQPGQKQE